MIALTGVEEFAGQFPVDAPAAGASAGAEEERKVVPASGSEGEEFGSSHRGSLFFGGETRQFNIEKLVSQNDYERMRGFEHHFLDQV